MKISFFFLLLPFMIVDSVLAQNEYLSGPVTEAQIREVEIFNVYANRYKPDAQIIEKINMVQDSIEIRVFMGTWCHDSKREVPALFKIMETIENSKITAKYTALEYKRRGPKEIIEANNIKRTPTFIVYKNGIEIGRIIEEVEVSVEADLYKIISES